MVEQSGGGASSLDVKPRAANRTRFAGMDGLRGLAAVMVVINHVGLYALPAGQTGSDLVDTSLRQLAGGVVLFFSLSGLLLYRPFAASIVGTGTTPSTRRYARNRFLRIAPTYWVILLVAAVAGSTLIPHPERMLATGGLFSHPEALFADALLVHNYAPSTFMTGIGPAWTLAIEVAFYLVLPVISLAVLALVRRIGRGRRLVFVPPLVLLVVGLTGKALAYNEMGSFQGGWSRNWPSVLARSFVANADLFAYGMALAAVVVLIDAGELRLPRGWRQVSVGLAAVCTVVAVTIGEFGEYPYDILMAVATTAALAVIVLGGGGPERRVRGVLESVPFTAVGLASYSLYLWHEPVIDWYANRGVFTIDGMGGLFVATLIVGVSSGILSALTYRFVERPSLGRKRAVTPTPTPTPATAVASSG